MNATKARLDADGTAKPMTAIVVRVRPGDVVGIWSRYTDIRIGHFVCGAHTDCTDHPELGGACYLGTP